MMQLAFPCFDYDALDPETRAFVQERTEEIKSCAYQTVTNIFAIGHSLIEVQSKLKRERFVHWLAWEFHWSHTTAYRFINVTLRFQFNNLLNSHFAPSALYALAGPNIPADARQEALDRATSGEYITYAIARSIIKKHVQKLIELPITIDMYVPVIEIGDALAWLPQQEPADLILTDPPYMTDVDDIEIFAASWLPLALAKLKPTGRAYICIGAYPKELHAYMSVAMPDQILVWTYRNTMGPSPRDNYKTNWQAILYYKGAQVPPLDCPIMTEQFTVQDIAQPHGQDGNRYHAWEKPVELGERFIRHATKLGDTVLDPFAGSGSFLLAATQLGRIGLGCELSPGTAMIAKDRGCQLLNEI